MSQSLLEIEDAWKKVESVVSPAKACELSLMDSVGKILAQDLVSDIDSPPFDKSLMDGFAIGTWQGPGNEYKVVETVTAGNVPQSELQSGQMPFQATKIMTGCPMPLGAKGVVMVEETAELDQGLVRIDSENFTAGQNVLRRGSVIESGNTLVEKGTRLEPHHVGALAEFGQTRLQVFGSPSVSVLTTGDELVPPEELPGPGQIRNSNGALLCELVRATGADVSDLGIGKDNKPSLNEKIRQGLESDILVIAGGVSAGVLDLIPQCLAENGVEQLFHKINLKPGKPLWFGRNENGTLVFGLPGNPVSSLVCFRLFVQPAVERMTDPTSPWLKMENGILTKPFQAKGGRRTFWPVRSQKVDGQVHVEPLPWKGSADQVTFLDANGLMDLNGRSSLDAGDPIGVVSLVRA